MAQSEGERLFIQICRACHTVGEGRLVGPDLLNVTKRRSEEWLLSFIKSSQTVIKNGDNDAVDLFKEFNQIIMPDQTLSQSQIKSILTYIEGIVVDKTKTVSGTEQFKLQNKEGLNIGKLRAEDFIQARKLFSGDIRLINNGPACISCHNVVDDNLISGGLLAKDLTSAYKRLGGEMALNSIITNPPFPVMAAAYANNPITPDEAFLLTAFLYKANKDSIFQWTHKDYQNSFLKNGIITAFVLFGGFGLLWWNRKRKSVNHHIYKRQLKTK
ncbi:MAG: hypothetical protein A2V93_03850 [Ignavibacteria bacterium RBG_16_34_14]|nr:MAG: hypothetical protein A2V93_03850 [Ignavibacteria bacterium RBG_16_34_14]